MIDSERGTEPTQSRVWARSRIHPLALKRRPQMLVDDLLAAMRALTSRPCTIVRLYVSTTQEGEDIEVEALGEIDR